MYLSAACRHKASLKKYQQCPQISLFDVLSAWSFRTFTLTTYQTNHGTPTLWKRSSSIGASPHGALNLSPNRVFKQP